MRRFTLFLAVLVTLLASATVIAAEHFQLRLGAVQGGTALWEIEAMRALGLDRAHDVDVVVRPLADVRAGHAALGANEVDVILSDFVYVSMQRHAGNLLSFVPHSLAVGGLMVDPAAGIATIADLRGKSLAVAGGPTDKNWMILEAYYAGATGRRLAADVDLRFGAAPLVHELATEGGVQASLNSWHWSARARRDGLVELASVPEMLAALGAQATPPLLGWTFRETMTVERSRALIAFLDASFDTKAALLADDGVWDTIRPAMDVGDDDALFAELRDAYRAGIVRDYDPAATIRTATRTLELLAEHGAPDIIGDIPDLAPATFWRGYRR